MIRLPDASCGEICAVLVAKAAEEALGIEALEVLVARQAPGSHEAEIFGRSLADARRSAAILGQLYEMFRTAAPFEAGVRTAVGALTIEVAA